MLTYLRLNQLVSTPSDEFSRILIILSFRSVELYVRSHCTTTTRLNWAAVSRDPVVARHSNKKVEVDKKYKGIIHSITSLCINEDNNFSHQLLLLCWSALPINLVRLSTLLQSIDN
jgi:hypothetical protein